MNAHRRPLALLYAAGSLVVVLVFLALTVMSVRQERDHARAVADALYHEDVRTALWRMDTRVGTLLATTTNRITPVQSASSVSVAVVDGTSNSVNPAPAPEAPLQMLSIQKADRLFATSQAEERVRRESAPVTSPPTQWTTQQSIEGRGEQRTLEEYDRRAASNATSQLSSQNMGVESCAVGPLAPMWNAPPAERELLMTRRVEGGTSAWHETFRLPWANLSETLLGEVRDLFPDAALVPVEENEDRSGLDARALRLATIPAKLVAPRPALDGPLPPAHVWTLAGAWIALLFALLSGGLALRSSYAYADKHRRFTHAVTHELRTPLTTFRMYSEMLARGMAPESSRAEYLATLEAESERLSRLVENVLRYARLEDGKSGPPLTDTTVADVVERCVPELARTCAAFSTRLEVENTLAGEVPIRTDADAALQVLSNLVENACKYGHPASQASPIRLRVTRERGEVCFDVSDDGPGVPATIARSIFEPFDRGGRDSSDRSPGVGLGLALARALAHELGGSLTLVPTTRGATFRFALPA